MISACMTLQNNIRQLTGLRQTKSTFKLQVRWHEKQQISFRVPGLSLESHENIFVLSTDWMLCMFKCKTLAETGSKEKPDILVTYKHCL